MASHDRRSYAQYCGAARALDVLGERWTLLIVRDLLPGPRRYGELGARLPGISTDLLTSRLRTLEEHGLVARETEVGVGRPVSYRLTAAGQELRPIIEHLADIGVRWLGAPAGSEAQFDLGWALGAAVAHLRSADVPAVPLVVSCPGQGYVLVPADERVVLRYLDGPVAGSVVLSGALEAVLGVVTGHISRADASVDVDGDPDAVSAWIDAMVAAVPSPIRGPHVASPT